MFLGIKGALRKHLQPNPPRPPYVYTPLAEDNSEIRVLTIRPGKFRDDICVELWTIPFIGKQTQAYEALSYTWGSPAKSRNINICHKGDIWTLRVSRNCADALRYLRYEDRPRTIWIDAICINQGDLKERSRQVTIMRPIYASASCVVVWIGPSSRNSSRAMRWIDTVRKEIAFDRGTERFHSLTQDTTREQSPHALISYAEVVAFESLLARPYFDRLWVWQEVRMGGRTAVLRCGNDQIPFQGLMTAVYYWLWKGEATSTVAGSLLRRTKFIAGLPIELDWSSLNTLDLLRPCKCTDQRDRVYTCMAFGNSIRELEIEPDYEQPLVEIYSQYILRNLRTWRDLKFLLYVGDVSPQNSSACIQGLPSWVPDWSRLNTADRFSVGFCGAHSQASIITADNAHLAVKGLKVGRIERSFYFGMDTSVKIKTKHFLSTLYTGLQAILPPEDKEKYLDHQVVRVLTAEGYSECYIPPRDLASLKECHGCLVNLLADNTDNADVMKAIGMFSVCRGRSLFLTDNGQVGLGPQHLQPGDCLALLLGSDVLMTLRPSEVDPSYYNVVGSALCTGMMDGEGLLGPMPLGHETVMVYNGEGANFPAFREKSSGEVSYEDPRLPPLPPDWVQEFDSPPLGYRNSRTGEWRWYLQDPRLDADALESRGVKLEEFRLT